MAESLFVTKCRGCEERYADLAIDDVLKRRFRLVEANKSAHSVQAERFIREHTTNCPEYARKKAEYWANKKQEKANAAKAARQAKQKPVPAALAKQDRGAVDKHDRSKQQSGEAVAPASRANNRTRLVEIFADEPEQQVTISAPQSTVSGPPNAISAPPVTRRAAAPAAPSQPTPLSATGNGTASQGEDDVKGCVRDFMRQVLYSLGRRDQAGRP